MGVLVRRADHQSPVQVMWDAEIALNRATRGPRRTCVFDSEMRARAVERMNLEVELRRAFDQEEIIPWYQPIYDLAARAPRGAEALVRWKHPERGLLQPGQFLSLASETGLIYPLGRRMLDEVCRNLGDLARRDPRLFVSVNMSWTELSHKEFYGRLIETLQRHVFPPERLWIEITEAVVIKQSPRTEQALRDLREAGVTVCVDDFGVGYSSLSYLQQLPVDVVKLDRSFLSDQRKDDRVLKAIVELAHGLDIRVVAEGLERPEQIELMRGMGCDYGQGLGLAGPMPLEDVLVILQGSHRPPTGAVKTGPSAG